ncbi:LysR substrate-binding domain-containing protein [Chitinibacteraceae bacterium HSL-7]
MTHKRRLPPLNTLRGFEAAARHLSFKHAAHELSLSPTAITHQIRSLEDELGVVLFERRVREIALTPAGAVLHATVRDALARLEAGLGELDRLAEARPVVTVSATPAFVTQWLIPRMAAFSARHPDIGLKVHASYQPERVAPGGVDLAIRYGRGQYAGLASALLIHDRLTAVARPGVAAANPAHWRLIRYDCSEAGFGALDWPAWFDATGLPAADYGAATRFTDEINAIEAAMAGLGVALLSESLLERELAAGTLERCHAHTLPGFAYHVVSPASGLSPAVATVRDWLLQEAARG